MDEPKSKPSYWAVLPSAVRYDPDLPAAAKLLYAEISALTEAKGYCYASNEYFQALFGMAERTLQRHLKALQAGGYIRIFDGSGGKARRKIFAGVNPLFADPDKNDGVTPSKMTGPPVKNDAHNIKETNKENDPPIVPQRGRRRENKEAPDWKPERFAGFWKYYPLHKSKQAAIRAWDKLKPSDELLAVIGIALKRQIAEAADKAARERRPFEWKLYASTFLNDERWTDDTSPVPAFQSDADRLESMRREADRQWSP